MKQICMYVLNKQRSFLVRTQCFTTSARVALASRILVPLINIYSAYYANAWYTCSCFAIIVEKWDTN
jgi:hypothetical protein